MIVSSTENLPIVEDLAAHDVPTYTPAVLPTLAPQPIVAEHLRVEVVCLERRVVDMADGTFEEEKSVVVDELVASIEPVES